MEERKQLNIRINEEKIQDLKNLFILYNQKFGQVEEINFNQFVVRLIRLGELEVERIVKKIQY